MTEKQSDKRGEGRPIFLNVGKRHELCRFPRNGEWSLRIKQDDDVAHVRYLNELEVEMVEATLAFTPSHELQITQAAGESADAVLHEKDASGMESSREGGKPSAPSTTPQTRNVRCTRYECVRQDRCQIPAACHGQAFAWISAGEFERMKDRSIVYSAAAFNMLVAERDVPLFAVSAAIGQKDSERFVAWFTNGGIRNTVARILTQPSGKMPHDLRIDDYRRAIDEAMHATDGGKA